MLTLLIIILLIALVFGGFGYRRGYGGVSLGPVGLIILIILLLYLTGYLKL